MHYIPVPTMQEDLNWVDWWIVGHEDLDALGSTLKKLCKDHYLANYKDEDHDDWVDDSSQSYRALLKEYLESQNYFIHITHLEWVDGITL
jgi:hypothetical protein